MISADNSALISRVLSKVNALAEKIELEYGNTGHKLLSFSKIAFDTLSVSDLSELRDLTDLERLSLQLKHFDKMMACSENFSDSPLILFENAHFIIQSLTWFDSSTEIHNHSFAGAFKVIKGESLQGVYKHSETCCLDRNTSVGQVKLEDYHWLQEGDCVEILPGDKFIHSLFHVSNPSVTLVIRTKGASCPQKVVMPSGFSWHYFAKKLETEKLKLFLKYTPIDCRETVMQIYTHISPNQWLDCFAHLQDSENYFIDFVRDDFGEDVAKCVAESIQVRNKLRGLLRLKQAMKEKQSRIILAVLFVAKDRRQFFDIVSKKWSVKEASEHLNEFLIRILELGVFNIQAHGEGMPFAVESILSANTRKEYEISLMKKMELEIYQQNQEAFRDFWKKITENYLLKALWK